MLVVAVAVVLGAVGCGASRDEGPFAYDDTRSLDGSDRGVVDEVQGIVLRDVSFDGGAGPVDGLLVAPRDAHGLPAVVYVHGAGGDRTSMLGAASWLAARGAVALTLTQPSSTTPITGDSAEARLTALRDKEVADVVAVRRAIDYLRTREEVDPDRIGYVGWSAGARTGALLAGVEPRLSAVVLLSGGSSGVDEFVAAAPAALRPTVKRTMTEIDPGRWIARARPERLLLQDARDDELVPRRALEALAHAAPDGADVRWYGGGHGLNEQAYRDQLDWLAERLEIEGPAVPGAPTGP